LPTNIRTAYIRPFPPAMTFRLAAPVKEATGIDAEVGVVGAEVTFETAVVAVLSV